MCERNKVQWLTIHVLQKRGNKKGLSTWMAELPYVVRHGCHVQTSMATKGIYLFLAIHDCLTGIFHTLYNIQNWRMPCKKEGRTNLQFSIFYIGYPACGKHSLDNSVRPCRDSKLMCRRRASYPSKVNNGKIKGIDVHELVYTIKKKAMSVAIMLCWKEAYVVSLSHQVEENEEKDLPSIYVSCHHAVLAVAILLCW